MTAPNVVVDLPTVRDRCDQLSGLFDAALTDCERLGLAPVSVEPKVAVGVASLIIAFADAAAVDVLAAAYGFGPAAPGGDLYGRSGAVPVNGERCGVLAYAPHPRVLALEAPTTSPALPVARPVRVTAERVDDEDGASS